MIRTVSWRYRRLLTTRLAIGLFLAAALVAIAGFSARSARADSDSFTLSVGGCTTGVGYSSAYSGPGAAIGVFDNLNSPPCYFRALTSWYWRVDGSWEGQSNVGYQLPNISKTNSSATGAKGWPEICIVGPVCTYAFTSSTYE